MKLEKLSLIVILIFSFLIRIVFINQLPPSLNWDEISHGYNAYSILKTGKDEWGNILPLIFRAYGDYKLPLYIYLTVPFVFIFGLNAIAVRLVSVISGTFLVLAIFLILKIFFPKKSLIPLVGSSLVAFSPITLFLSRIALEANLFLLLATFSFYFLLIKKYGLSATLFGLSLFSYNSSRVLLPFYLLLLFASLFYSKFNFKKYFYRFLFLFLTIVIFIFQSFNSSGQARYKLVTLIDQGTINHINELRQYYPRIIINKYTYFIFTATVNYFSHFNPKFLFSTGGSNYQFNIPDFYFFSPLLLLLFVLGLIYLFLQIKNNKNKFPFLIMLFWLLIAPIPSAITRDAPHTLRSIILLPIVVLIISFGFNYLITKFKKITVLFIFSVLAISQFSFWSKYKIYTRDYSDSWQYGYQEVAQFIQNNYNQYDQIIFTKKYGEPHEFMLFYLKLDPHNYQASSTKSWNFHDNWYWIDAYDKFLFINDWEIKDKTQDIPSEKKILLITSPKNYNQSNSQLITTVNFLNQKPAFDILNLYASKN